MINQINFDIGIIESAPVTVRYLRDLEGYFLDSENFFLMAADNPVVYTLSSVEYAQGDGQLHCGVGTIMPGKVGSEYFFTRGHFHTWRPAAELYLGMSGEGYLLMESEDGQCELAPLTKGTLVYVPGYTAHRTINTGSIPLSYLGIYPAQAGHDYAVVKAKNFKCVVLEIDGKPQQVERQAYLSNTLHPRQEAILML